METGLRRIRYFDTLARELNFRRSAEKLSITQPALSRAIAQLEYEVGARLLERTNRTVTLTLAGETFASGCQRILSGIDAAIDETQKVAKGRAGTLVVGYTDTAIAGNLPDLIRSFLLDTPDVFIRLIQLFSTQQLTMLRDGLIDVGIMTGPIDQPDLMAMDVQVDRFVALVPRGNRLAGEHSVTLAELAEFPVHPRRCGGVGGLQRAPLLALRRSRRAPEHRADRPGIAGDLRSRRVRSRRLGDAGLPDAPARRADRLHPDQRSRRTDDDAGRLAGRVPQARCNAFRPAPCARGGLVPPPLRHPRG